MSERHLMFCNLIAWKEGDEYVFEDGSKAYPYPDNDKRFDRFMLIPDWVVKGLTDTPFRYFGFKNGKIYVKRLGIFTREEFESKIVKYKYEKLTIESEDDLFPIISEFMYSDRVFYSSEGREYKIKKASVGFRQCGGFFTRFRISFLDTAEVVKSPAIDIFCSLEGGMVSGRGTSARVVRSFLDKNDGQVYCVLEFCDGSITTIRRTSVRAGMLCHSEVLSACKDLIGVCIKAYNFKDDKWFVTSTFGTDEKSVFIEKAHAFRCFIEDAVGKTFKAPDECVYTIVSKVKRKGRIKFSIRLENGNEFYYSPVDIYMNRLKPSMRSTKFTSYSPKYVLDGYKDWVPTKMGLYYRVIGLVKGRLYTIELSNGDICTVNRARVKSGRVYPSLITREPTQAYVGRYKGTFISAIYFDFKEDLYVLLTRDRDILYVSRDGELKKSIKHDES